MDQLFLGKLYFAFFLRKVGLEELEAARQYLARALHFAPSLVERQEELFHLIMFWMMEQPSAPRLTLVQHVLDNLPGDSAKAKQLRQRVLGNMHISQAFGEYRGGRGGQTRCHILKGLRYDLSYLKNRGVIAIFARSFLYKQTSDPKSTYDYGNPAESVPKLIISEVEAALGCTVDSFEDLSGGKVYLIEAGGKPYILRPLSQSAVEKKISMVEHIRAVGVPTPAILASSLPARGNVPAWILEEWMPGSHFIPPTMSVAAELAIATDLGRYLRRLHTINMKEFGGVLSAQLDTPYQTLVAQLDSRQQSIMKACVMGLIPEATLPVLDTADRFLRESYAGPCVLCHGDLGYENVLVDAGRVTAIIDWEDARWGDPAYDIAELLAGMSQYWYPVKDNIMLTAVLMAYDSDKPDEFSRRVIAHRLLLAAAEIVHMDRDKNEYFDVYRSILSDACIGGVFLH